MELKQLEENLNNLMNAFDNHKHCIKCGKPLPVDERYRDSVCDSCKKPKEGQHRLPGGLP